MTLQDVSRTSRTDAVAEPPCLTGSPRGRGLLDRHRPGTTTVATALAVVFSILLAGTCPAQTTSDRRGGTILVNPTSVENQYSIGLLWSFAVEPAAEGRSLSTHLDLYVNGTRVATELVDIDVHGGSTFCGAPPCNGSCGSVTIAGSNAALLCYFDGPPPSTDCDCGQWITTGVDDSCYLEPGDEIMILLRPATGSEPELETGNDSSRITFEGGPSFWNRSVREVHLEPTSVPDVYDIQVEGMVEFDGLAGTSYLDLGFEIVLESNGVAIARQLLPQDVEPANSGSCFYLGCGNYCAVINGIQSNCDEVLFNGCMCGAGWILFFPGVELDPSEELVIVLRPVPGALPELPGFEEDDEYVLDTPSSVEEPGGHSVGRLLSARPNPARASAGTKLGFELTKPAAVRLEIVDISGRSIRTLAHSKYPSGTFHREWNLRNDAGERVANGVYFYAMTVDGADPEVLKLLVVE